MLHLQNAPLCIERMLFYFKQPQKGITIHNNGVNKISRNVFSVFSPELCISGTKILADILNLFKCIKVRLSIKPQKSGGLVVEKNHYIAQTWKLSYQKRKLSTESVILLKKLKINKCRLRATNFTSLLLCYLA